MAFLFAVLLVISPLIVHEAGHWAALRRLNIPVIQFWLGLGPMLVNVGRIRIGMLPIGGAVVPEPVAYAKLPPICRVIVALAGPAASLAYGVALVVFARLNWIHPSFHALQLLGMMNFYLAVVNLIPVPPLDGFHALASWKEHKGNPFPAQVLRFAHRLGSGFVYGVGFCILASVFFK